MSSENLLHPRPVKATLDTYGLFLGTPQSLDHNTGCFSLLVSLVSGGQSKTKEGSYIHFRDILWCSSVDPDDQDIHIKYVVHENKKAHVHNVTVELAVPPTTTKDNFVDHIMKLAYGESKVRPSVLVVLNNHGGQGLARKLFRKEIEPVLSAANVNVSYIETKYLKHAVDIGREVDIDKYDIIACCSGDGVPHEIINGMFQRPDRARAFAKVAVTQLPCGSGNALSLSTHGSNLPSVAALYMLKLTSARLDLMAVTQGTGASANTHLSFLSQAYGVIADSDIGTEHLRWMGPVRFELGIAHKIFTKARYPCDLYVAYATKTGPEIQEHVASHLQSGASRLETINEDSFAIKLPPLDSPPPSHWEKVPSAISDNLNIFYVGNMPYMLSDAQFFPAALPDDGHMDMVISDVSTPFLTMTKILMSVDNGGHVHSDQIHHAKVTAYRLVPRVQNPKAHFISVDGESFPFEPLQVEVLPGLLKVLLQNGAFVETKFTETT